MILQSLVKYYENLEKQGLVSELGWCHAKVSYAINLSEDGQVLGIQSRKIEEVRGKKTVWIPALVRVPEMVTRSSGIAANFLCDNAKYILGIDKNGNDKRVIECYEVAKELHLEILKYAQGRVAKAIRNYFLTWKPQKAKENPSIADNWEELTDGANLIFCLDAEDVQEDVEIQTCWRNHLDVASSEVKGICMVTGQKTEISRIHKVIKGVPGAQSSGAALISFNAPSFESYEKTQSYNAPVGRYAEFAYTTALNYLLSQRDYTFSLGDSMVVFWAGNGKKKYQKGFFNAVKPTKDNSKMLRDLFDSLKQDTKVYLEEEDMDPNQIFNILAVSPNAARISVRFFYQNTFGNILNNIKAHYRRLNIVKPIWVEQEYLGIKDMLNATVNQKSNNKSPIPSMAALVMQSILSGTRYPACLYTNVLIRIRAEAGDVKWNQAAIIKAYLIQNYHCLRGDDFVGLNEECTNTAYILGRLFSVLESIQRDANPGIKATIRDRYFNSACTTPATVFPVLLKLKNSHIKKLERENGGFKVYYEKKITELCGKISEYPKRLSLEQQGQFMLGYYHQQQKKYEKVEEK